jgi:anti-anti-sigma regulatory factor
MPVALQRYESHCAIRLEGQITLSSAAELKELLLEWLAAGKDLQLDLEGVEEIDIAILQLLSVAAREAAGAGVKITGRASGAALVAARDSGFAQIPDFPVSGPEFPGSRDDQWVK